MGNCKLPFSVPLFVIVLMHFLRDFFHYFHFNINIPSPGKNTATRLEFLLIPVLLQCFNEGCTDFLDINFMASALCQSTF